MSSSAHPLADRLCLAMDTADRDAVLTTVDELAGLVGWIKLNSAFTLHGPDLVRAVLDRGAKVFLDLKLHDIPNTLSGYGDAVTRLGVHLVTLHTEGGLEMLRAAVAAADDTAAATGSTRPKLVGVTLLTSIDQDVLSKELNVAGTVESEVARRAQLAAEAGLDGIVCAPGEVAALRPDLPTDFFFVTPGARSPGTSGDDHRRVGTHADAVAAGSSLLVVGRRVLDAPDRAQAVREVLAEIEPATAEAR
jgi:orotidine-5'-phosphate decarboxylase